MSLSGKAKAFVDVWPKFTETVRKRFYEFRLNADFSAYDIILGHMTHICEKIEFVPF